MTTPHRGFTEASAFANDSTSARATARAADASLPPIRVAALVLIRDQRLLMVTARGRDVLFLPGGKIDPGETAAEAVVRESREEVAVELDEQSIRSLFTVLVQAHGEPQGRMVEMTLFEATTADDPTPSAEVDAVHWVTSADAFRCPPAGVETLRQLVELGLID
ncbi:MAG: pyrophosphohydrolase [Subtercola sp.]|nr:pyrophosphohydrolase [Subtercola sp.]